MSLKRLSFLGKGQLASEGLQRLPGDQQQLAAGQSPRASTSIHTSFMHSVIIHRPSANVVQQTTIHHRGCGAGLALHPLQQLLTASTGPQVELEHRSSKAIYSRINKHDPERDIGRMHRRREVLQYLANSRMDVPAPRTSDLEPWENFKMSEGTGDYVNLSDFLMTPRGMAPDPAKKVCPPHSSCISDAEGGLQGFMRKLKNYVLRWTSVPDPNITSYEHFTDEHRRHVRIVSDALYRHKTLQLMYTTYDMREDQDKVYQRRYPDIMALSDDKEHPYLYGRILDFFHVDAMNNGPTTLLTDGSPAILQMAWIRWLKLDTQQGPSGFHSLRYPSVSFYESDDPDAFGFLHPDEIVRVVHLIPRFSLGRTTEYMKGPSKGRPESEHDDWKCFNVNMWVGVVYTLLDAYPYM